jgi:hypothetical protein
MTPNIACLCEIRSTSKSEAGRLYGLTSMTLRINRFSGFVHHPDSKELEDKNTMFQKLGLFLSSGEGDTYSVGSLRKS